MANSALARSRICVGFPFHGHSREQWYFCLEIYQFVALFIKRAHTADLYIASHVARFATSIICVRQGRYVMPGVCLSVCLFVCQQLFVKTTERILHENFITDVLIHVEEVVKFRSRPPPDPDPGFFEGFFNTARQGFFHNLPYISGDSDEIFMKMLSLIAKKSPLNFGSNSDPESGSSVRIRLRIPTILPWRTQAYAVCDCSCLKTLSYRQMTHHIDQAVGQ